MQNSTESAPPPDSRILEILDQHEGGATITELSTALKQLTAAAQLTGKGGTVTLEIKLAPAKGTRGTLGLSTKVKTKLPTQEPYTSIFYANADLNLVREDPAQKKLDLKEVPAKQTATLKELPNAA